MYFAKASLKEKHSHPLGAGPRCVFLPAPSLHRLHCLLAFLKNVQDLLGV